MEVEIIYEVQTRKVTPYEFEPWHLWEVCRYKSMTKDSFKRLLEHLDSDELDSDDGERHENRIVEVVRVINDITEDVNNT